MVIEPLYAQYNIPIIKTIAASGIKTVYSNVFLQNVSIIFVEPYLVETGQEQ